MRSSKGNICKYQKKKIKKKKRVTKKRKKIGLNSFRRDSKVNLKNIKRTKQLTRNRTMMQRGLSIKNINWIQFYNKDSNNNNNNNNNNNKSEHL